MEAINVSVYECNAIPGVDAPVASTSVNDGEYMFGMGSDDPGADVCLDAGTDYFVVFDIPMGAGEVLDGFEFTEQNASPACETAGGSSDVNPLTGHSDCYDPNNDDAGADVCLEAGAEYFVVFDIPMGAGEVLDGFESVSYTHLTLPTILLV